MFWFAGLPISTPIPPPLPKCPHVKLMKAPIGAWWALKFLLPAKMGTLQNRIVAHHFPLLLHRVARQPADELTLQREEQHCRRDDRDQRPGQENAVLLAKTRSDRRCPADSPRVPGSNPRR